MKWCRYFIDFCLKTGRSPRESDSIAPFLAKLASKGQGAPEQAQARKAVLLLQEVLRGIPVGRVKSEVTETILGETGTNKSTVREGGSPEKVKYSGSAASGESARGGREGEEGVSWPRAYELLEERFATGQYARTTRTTYRSWIRGYEGFLREVGRGDVSSESAAAYLTYLAKERGLTASSQNQAFNALLFFFRKVLDRPYEPKEVKRAKSRRYVPVVLSETEVGEVFSELEGTALLIAQMLYGSGLRLTECLSLRVQSLDFDQLKVTIHRGKGGKDRSVPMAARLVEELREQLKRCRAVYEEDLESGFAGAFAPETGSERKWKSRMKEWPWQFLFPQETLTKVEESGEWRRFHFHEKTFSQRLRAAVEMTGIHKRVTAHTFRHSFASHLLVQGHDIKSIQEVLGHSDIKTTMIYLQTVPALAKKEMRSPFDSWEE
ncbi:MAG: integron integrase [Verrucomicrobiota bacterium JB023]|nr:integron integrase [Verrucomicrobiota bacterium JB023]